MAPEELDRQLRGITEHEQQYRQGIVSLLHMRFEDYGGIRVARQSMRDMVDYALKRADDAGRTLCSTKIIIFKHGRFRDYPLHAHDFVEFSYLYDGSCTQVINDRMYRMQSGQVLIMDSDVVHTIAPLDENDILVNICIDKDYLNGNFFNRLNAGSPVTEFFAESMSRLGAHDHFMLFHSEDDARLRTLMIELLCEWFDPSPMREVMLTALFTCVVTELANVFDSTAPAAGASRDNVVLAALRAIEDECATCSLKAVAQRLYVSPASLSRALKAQTGHTFRELVIAARVREAARLLEGSTMPVVDVARRVGYTNVTFFYEVFERLMDCSPGAYRAREQEKAHVAAGI